MLTQQKLKELLSYDPETGVFSKPDGSNYPLTGSGPYRIKIDKSRYPTHRVAYLFMTGDWPPNLIDHKNGDNTDNRWDNLRPATPSQNATNIKDRKDNTSGHVGVSWRKDKKKWAAHIGYDNKPHHLGYFKTKEEAIQARIKAEEEHQGEWASRISRS